MNDLKTVHAQQALEYANEIRTQLRWGRNPNNGTPMLWSWGAHGWTCSGEKLVLNTGGGTVERVGRAWLRFSVTGLKFRGLVYVILTGGDDYTILLVKNKRRLNKELTEVFGRKQYDTFAEIQKEVEDIYCDRLSETIHYLIEADR